MKTSMTDEPAHDHAHDGGHEHGHEHAHGHVHVDASPTADVPRRTFLQVMGTLVAMGAGCTKQPPERIVAQVRAPEGYLPGKPLFYATASVVAGVATGVLAEQNEGRPTKLEGNPEHPASLGATDAITQAATFDLYDPERSKTLTHLGQIAGYGGLLGALQKAMLAHKSKRGEGLHLLTGAVGSPSLFAQLQELLSQHPLAKWHWYEPVHRTGARSGASLAFDPGAQDTVDAEPRLDLARADVIVSLDADLFGTCEGRLRYARDFSTRRRPEAAPSRLYVFEATPSITGAKADHRFAVRAADVEVVARALAARLGVQLPPTEPPAGVKSEALDAMARDLLSARGRSVVAAGDFQPAGVHALAHAINLALGNVGTTVTFAPPPLFGPLDPVESLRELVVAMDAGKVETLLVIGNNPAYDAPADFAFAERLKKVRLAVHLGLYDDETAGRCHWHVPAAHWLETWSDGRAYDGTETLMQPIIAPLYGGKSAHELLVALSDRPDRTGYEVIRARFAANVLAAGGAAAAGSPAQLAAFETAWRYALHEGVAMPAPPPVHTPRARDLRALPAPPTAQGLEIVFRPDPSVFDGRFAHNPWLQELPRPLTKLTWDNAAFVSPADAQRLGLATGDVVELGLEGRTVNAPVWVLPGQTPGSVAVHLGYGRTRGSRVGVGVGFDAYRIRTSKAPWHASGLSLKKTGATHVFATTQGHHRMEGRDLVRTARFGEEPASGHGDKHGKHLSIYPDFVSPVHAWAMAIDLATCIGCNACVAACNTENNVPVVGKSEVLRGREMQWLRVDRYYQGTDELPTTHFQPIPCMHCETAPCEPVCPVQATVHSNDGLNDMVYNRCVGTKYCQNNCPYKVRRYNFFGYSTDDVFGLANDAPSMRLYHNPDVTVRSYGVMEKCTYCVQRINFARIEAKKENRRVRDGEVMTACQAVCPVEAITFGDKNDPTAAIAQRIGEPRNYALLAELNTKPRTTYLSELRNPNPELER
jgi:molybdopterin-containing oxidoreductase family iron-sulfur binding subunit